MEGKFARPISAVNCSVQRAFEFLAVEVAKSLCISIRAVMMVLDQDRSDRSWSGDQRLVFWDNVGLVLENIGNLTDFCIFCSILETSSSACFI